MKGNIVIPKHQNNYKLVSGTHLQGYIKCDYKTLIETFGKPDSECDGYKTDREWILKFGDGTVATIYNYKNGWFWKCSASRLPMLPKYGKS